MSPLSNGYNGFTYTNSDSISVIWSTNLYIPMDLTSYEAKIGSEIYIFCQ